MQSLITRVNLIEKLRNKPTLFHIRKCYQFTNNQTQQLCSIIRRNKQFELDQKIQCNSDKPSELYTSLKGKIYETQLPNIDTLGDVFPNNELNLVDTKFFGFNFDYTLARYPDELHHVLYRLAVDRLVRGGYPSGIKEYQYNSSFAIRGLHFDMNTSYLMKLNSMNHVQLGAVYRGYEKVCDYEVLEEYGGTLINVDLIGNDTYTSGKDDGRRIFQRMDSYSLPFLSLLTNVIDHFVKNNIPFNPSYIYLDVERAIDGVVESKEFNRIILSEMDKYIPKSEQLVTYFNTLLSNKKKLFLMTNRSFDFIDKGMTHLFDSRDWRDMFQLVIVDAKKPKFFTDRETKPFRKINLDNGAFLWEHAQRFERHGVYGEGNINLFTKFTGFEGSQVIYFGAHVHSDLVNPVERIGWRTGVIIRELENEIEIGNSMSYRRDIEWLVTLEKLINALQDDRRNETVEMMNNWKVERRNLRTDLKILFNPYFGSMFRTHQNPTSFSNRITQYADLYMSSIENLLNYSHDCHFLASRKLLPHERI